MIKINQIVIHKLSNQRMRVIKIYDDIVAKCLLDNPFEYAMAWKIEKQELAVCLIDNLEPELTLFNGEEYEQNN